MKIQFQTLSLVTAFVLGSLFSPSTSLAATAGDDDKTPTTPLLTPQTCDLELIKFSHNPDIKKARFHVLPTEMFNEKYVDGMCRAITANNNHINTLTFGPSKNSWPLGKLPDNLAFCVTQLVEAIRTASTNGSKLKKLTLSFPVNPNTTTPINSKPIQVERFSNGPGEDRNDGWLKSLDPTTPAQGVFFEGAMQDAVSAAGGLPAFSYHPTYDLYGSPNTIDFTFTKNTEAAATAS